MGRQRVKPGPQHFFGIQLNLATGSWIFATLERVVRRGQVQPGESIALQPLIGDTGQGRVVAIQSLPDQFFIAVLESRIVITHLMGQAAKDFRIGLHFAQRRNDRLAQLDVEMAVGGVQVQAFKSGWGWQHDVGVTSRISHYLFVDHAEKVFALKARDYFAAVGRDHRRVGVIDKQSLYRRLLVVQESLAQFNHINSPGKFRVAAQEGWLFQGGPIERKSPASAKKRSAANLGPGSHQGR